MPVLPAKDNCLSIRIMLNRILFNIVVFFVFFDGIRSNLIFSNYLTMVREGATFLLVGLTFASLPRPRFNASIWTLLLLMVYHTIIVLCSFIQEGPITWSFAIRPYELIGMIFVFENYRELTRHSYSHLIRRIVNTAIVFGITNILLYYLPLPIWNRDHFWWGRISCGYPTMDVVSLSYALVFLLHYKSIGWKVPKVVLYAILLSIFILLNFSGSGALLLLFIILISMLYRHSRKVAGGVLAIGSFIFLFGMVTLQQYFPQEYSQGKTLLETKYKNLIGDDTADANTLEIREDQYNKAKRRLDNFIVELLGVGINYATNDKGVMKKYRDAYMIENEYNLIRVCYGFIGLSIFVAFILQIVFVSMKSHNIIGLLGGGVFAVNSFTLIPFVLYPNIVLLALLYVLATTHKMQKEPNLIVKYTQGGLCFIFRHVQVSDSHTNSICITLQRRKNLCGKNLRDTNAIVRPHQHKPFS